MSYVRLKANYRQALPLSWTSQEMKYLQKSLPGFGKMALCYASLGQAQALQSELMAAIIDRVFLGEEWDVRSEQVFKRRLEEGKTKLMTTANQVCELVAEILSRFHSLQKTLPEQTGRSHAASEEIRDQLDRSEEHTSELQSQ